MTRVEFQTPDERMVVEPAFRAAVYCKDRPIIAVFFGIVIRMFYKEHEPPHFHAGHQGQQAKFDFSGNRAGDAVRSGHAV